MKVLLPLFTSAALASALGTPVIKHPALVARDAATVTSAIADISDATESLQAAVSSFSADSADALQSASSNVVDTIKAGDSAVKASGDLSQSDALSVAQPVQDLADQVDAAVDAVIAKKSDFVDAGLGGAVYQQLVEQRDAAKAFSETVTGKVPEALQQTAQGLSAPIQESLEKGIKEFEDQKGQTGGSSSSAGGSSSAAAATSGASSAASSSAAAASSGASEAVSSASSEATEAASSASASASEAVSAASSEASGAAASATSAASAGSAAASSAAPTSSEEAVATGAAAPGAVVACGAAVAGALAMVVAF